MTQLEMANDGRITPEMERVAACESIDAQGLSARVRDGLVVIPANVNHTGLEPIGIGEGLRTKVNANIGTSPGHSCVETELVKLRAAIDAGADTVMDLSVGGDLDEVLRSIAANCPIPLGTVPLYSVAVLCADAVEMTADRYLAGLENHARAGVDFATVHAGVTRACIPLVEKRVVGVVSRGGALLIKWMRAHGAENFLYERYDDILDIAREYDVTLSLGDGLRPGCIEDATDEAQLVELSTLGELARRARERGVQVMIEGPGHIPLHEVAENVRLQKERCDNAPFYVLGPLPTDITPGYDHITGAIGGALAAMSGADFLCYVTPKEHVGLPGPEDVAEGVIVTRIAAHVGDIAKDIKGARQQDRRMSEARARRDWSAMLELALDPGKFGEMLAGEDRDDKCSMCGEFCALKVFRGEDEKERPE